LFAVAGAAVLLPIIASSAPPRLGGPLIDGSVVRVHGCGSYFFVSYENEYDLVEWIGGEPVKEGDVLEPIDDASNLEREGRGTFTNRATGRTIDVVIDRALMNGRDYSLNVGKYCR